MDEKAESIKAVFTKKKDRIRLRWQQLKTIVYFHMPCPLPSITPI